MKTGETRIFKLPEDKPDCQLKEKEISIVKTKNVRERKFTVVGHEEIAFIQCYPGYVHLLTTEGITEGCGIAKILFRLCLNEKKIHNFANKKENAAFNSITNLGLKNKKLIHWATSQCSKVVTLSMSARPPTGAYSYFNGALESGYTYMFVETSSGETIYPTEGPCSVKLLRDEYDGNGYMERNKGNKAVDVYGKAWYFCLPKQPMSLDKCAIM